MRLTPFEAFILGFMLCAVAASVFVVFGYKLARAHEDQAREFKEFSSRFEK